MPWRKFKAEYDTKATTALKESGWDLHNLEKASQSLHDHGTLEPGQLEGCRPRANEAHDSDISGERSAFD